MDMTFRISTWRTFGWQKEEPDIRSLLHYLIHGNPATFTNLILPKERHACVSDTLCLDAFSCLSCISIARKLTCRLVLQTIFFASFFPRASYYKYGEKIATKLIGNMLGLGIETMNKHTSYCLPWTQFKITLFYLQHGKSYGICLPEFAVSRGYHELPNIKSMME